MKSFCRDIFVKVVILDSRWHQFDRPNKKMAKKGHKNDNVSCTSDNPNCRYHWDILHNSVHVLWALNSCENFVYCVVPPPIPNFNRKINWKIFYSFRVSLLRSSSLVLVFGAVGVIKVGKVYTHKIRAQKFFSRPFSSFQISTLFTNTDEMKKQTWKWRVKGKDSGKNWK